ncbi:DegT/DnrJ/EryC1/StrS family aminotransferase [Stenotrophomonas maltophilia]|uniref:DegT/DnrJ/EryC1/StrS family aminotransferase n=1 Tax=Stenotrophomonas maltophilia TaxID=40324 RepID=UPI000C148144|nr:DegT/DnrJ/EryC1/StrS family aminotransferase [Stenotrophomonas maltophilia]EKT4066734.1 DegT/DnrJ/EryC1/StrS family aminotransferase [Stenotrophomonas maltophilia]MBK5594699.1 DegT/DnrJ/EryC1/StrS family aminotransferase [Stenotrophomonas maltophilia]MCF3551731.1 DegT/DnrJ/EryC1/StrS aminotransferase [Stenotrophomonas maltophilia]MCF3559863.1 DegT/DnrJ/EryC1/StrS aminotransferase [Stenotrophomonas maltophilia]MCF3563249.1 DegT/DnrJ/EryC1/StrS aminotransferase [Stenotrophomonas maltophilia]
MRRIPLLIPRMPSADKVYPYLRKIDQNRIYTNYGPLNGEFEQRLATELGQGLEPAHLTTVSNCTVGLELAIQALALPAGARVLLPSLTFVATATAIVRVGATPLFSDIDPSGWCLTPAIAEDALARGEAFDLVMPVSTFGKQHDVTAWDDFSAKTGIPVLIDAAGAFGNQPIGRTTDVVFSFHATKSIGSGEGGLIVSFNAERIRRIRQLANFGIDAARGELIGLGTNGKLSEYHAAVGLAALDEWPDIVEQRRELHARYLRTLRQACPSVGLQDKDPDGIYPLLPVLLPDGVDALAIGGALREQGIDTRRWYCPPLHAHGVLAHFDRSGSLDVTAAIGDRILGLPFFAGITDEEIGTVVDSLARAISTESAGVVQ